MRILLTVIILLLTSACSTLHSNDPDSLAFSLPEGSTLSLNQKLPISASDTHGVIQAGKAVTDNSKNDYAINCRLDFKDFGPRLIEPEKFIITRTEDGSNWISQPSILRFYTEIYLTSSKNTDIIKLVCQEYGDSTDRNFTVAEMQAALGDYITFIYSTKKITN